MLYTQLSSLYPVSMGTIMQQTAVLILRLIVIQLPVRLFCSLWRYQCTYLIIAKFHYTDPTRTRHGLDPTRTKSAHIVGDELNSTTRTRTRRKSVHVVGYELYSTTRTRHGPDRTRTDPHGLFLRRNSVGSVRVRSGPCSVI